MRVAIIGSREYSDEAFITKQIISLANLLVNKGEPFEFVSGGAKSGADFICKEMCDRNDWPYKEFPAEWDRYRGKSAAAIRNKQIVDYCDFVVAFWNGQTERSGTWMVIKMAEEVGKPANIYLR